MDSQLKESGNQDKRIFVWKILAISFIVVSMFLCIALVSTSEALKKETAKLERYRDIADEKEKEAFEAWKEKYGVKHSFVASVNGDKYHKTDCTYAKNIKEENAVFYQSKHEAELDEKKPCSVCKP